MWCMGGMQVHEIRDRRLVHKEVVQALSKYKKFCFWRFGNSVYSDLTGSNQTEKDQARAPPRRV